MLESVSSARAGFTRQDILFIESLHDASQSAAIRRLTQDPESLQELLDQPEIRRLESGHTSCRRRASIPVAIGVEVLVRAVA